jgi:two-component system, cell cycle sensor histidine kinase and response regulator CckA
MASSEAERANRRLLALAETMRALAETTADYPRLLDTIAERTVRYICDGCAIVLVSDDGVWLRPAAVHHRDERATRDARALLGAAPARVDGPGQAAKVVRTGKSVLVPRVELEALREIIAPQYLALVTRLDIRSLLYVPLRRDGRVPGVLALFRAGAGASPFDDEDEAFAGNLADLAALTISNAQLLQSAQCELEERKRAEAETTRLVALIQHSSEFIAMASLDGHILFINESGRALVGLERDRDLSDLSLRDFHTDDGMKRAALLRAEGRWHGEGQLRHFVTGELIDVQISSFLVRDAKGEPFGYGTVQRDVRAMKRLENHLRQVQKMEALGRLAGGIAHDFNNLLTIILSYSAMLRDDLATTNPARADIEEIHTAGERAAALTMQLLAFSRQQVLEPRVLDLGTIVVAMEKMTRRLLGEDITLRVLSGQGLRAIRVDAAQMEQVILNLAVNARDAMPGGGVLTIATENVDLDDAYAAAHVGTRAGPYVALTVSDTGTGMDEATVSRIFEPFFTTKDQGKGTGLGLATVFGIVKQSGGHITVESEPGKGTTFRVVLPQNDAATPDAPAPRAAPTAKPTGSETILLVEDEAQVRALLRGILVRAGYRVLDPPDPEEALRDSERFAGEIHLLVTDVVMPKMNGRQLAERVTSRRAETRVLYLSGYAEGIIAHHGVLDPGVSFLRKPVTPEALLQRVREVLDSPV